MTWALKDRSDVNRTFWEWNPEEDNLLKFRIPLPSFQHTKSGPNLNLGVGGFQSSQALGVPCERCLPRFPGPGLIKPSLACVRPLGEELDYELWALEQDSEDPGPHPYSKCRAGTPGGLCKALGSEGSAVVARSWHRVQERVCWLRAVA